MTRQPKNRKQNNRNSEFKKEKFKNKDVEKQEFEDFDEFTKEDEKSHKDEVIADDFDKEKFEEGERLKSEIDGLKKELEDFKQLNLRLKAEFDNFKKRTQKEKISTYDLAKSDCVVPFLEVLDNLERAVGLVEKKDKFSEGIDLVVNKFYEVLKKIGVVEIESLGKVFDPNFHEAIKIVEDEKFDKNTVCEVFQKGFMLNDVVVRHALVVVANP